MKRVEEVLAVLNLPTGHLPSSARDSHEQDALLCIRDESRDGDDMPRVLTHGAILRAGGPQIAGAASRKRNPSLFLTPAS
jgi:hypothetical protein